MKIVIFVWYDDGNIKKREIVLFCSKLRVLIGFFCYFFMCCIVFFIDNLIFVVDFFLLFLFCWLLF